MALRDLTVRIGANTTGFDRGLKRVRMGISSLARTAAGLAGVALGVRGITNSFKAYVGLESSVARVNDLFGQSSKYITHFAESTAKGFGMAESSAYQYAATYGNLFKQITVSSEENAKVTLAMLKASSVVASKTGRTMEDVMERIRSGLLGNTEAIEDLGINVNVAMLEVTDAFKKISNGRSWEKLSFYEQQQIRTLAILEQAHKNFGNEVQQGSAFSLSVLSGAFKDLQASAGIFINAGLQPIIRGLTTLVQWATAGLKALAGIMGLKVNLDMSGASSEISSGASSAEDMAEGIDKTGKAAKKAKKELAGFDEINTIGGNEGKSEEGTDSIGTGASVFGDLPELEYEAIEMDSSAMEQSFEKIKATVEPTITAIKNLWVAMEPFKNFVAQGIEDFYNNFLVPVGVWTFGEGIPRFIEALSKGFQSVNWSGINESLNNLWNALTPFAINVGSGLLWFWENVLVPLGSWTVSNVVPVFLDLLSGTLKILNSTIEALKPLALWLFDTFLKPIAEWTGGVIVSVLEGLSVALNGIGDWMSNNQSIVDGFTIAIVGFFAAWKLTELLAFVQMSGGVIAAISGITQAIKAGTIAKLADKYETIAITALYAKDFVLGIGKSTVALANSVIQWGASTAAMVGSKIAMAASTVAQLAMTAATVAWNTVCVIATAVTATFSAAVAFLTSPIGLVVVAITALIAVGVLLYKNWNEVSAFLTKTWDSIKTKANEVWNGLKDFFSNTWNGIKSNTEQVWNNIKNFVTTKWNDIKTGISNTKNALVSAIKEPFNIAKDWINGVIKDAFSWGKNLIGNIVDGIKSMVGKVKSAVTNVADTIGDFLGFHSPSKKGPGSEADHWMPNLMDMLADGIKDNVYKINASVDMAAGSLGNIKVTDSSDVINTASNINLPNASNDIEKALNDAIMSLARINNNNNSSGTSQPIVMKINEAEFGRVVINAINKYQRMVGETLLEV